MRLLISGFTAAGKTTHGELLAGHYGVPFVPMSEVMRSVLEERSGGGAGLSAGWTPSWDALRQLDDSADREADRRMVANVEKGPGVYDAWAMPWLYRGEDAIRLWINSDKASRSRKCTVSALMQGREPPDDPAGLIAGKDNWTISWFRDLYGFELGPDPKIFDLVADNSELIPRPTKGCARRGIVRFQRELVRMIDGVRGV